MIMNGSEYLEIITDHVLQFWSLHRCKFFMNNEAPIYNTNLVHKWLHNSNIAIREWPKNSYDLNEMEKA